MLKLDRNGYIYHLLMNYTPRDRYDNLCDVMKGLLVSILFICTIIGFVVFFTASLFAWVVPLVAYNFSWAMAMNEPIFGGSLTSLGILTLFCLAAWGDYEIAVARRNRINKLYANGYDKSDDV